MSRVQHYWAQRREVEQTLPEIVFLTSISYSDGGAYGGRGGVVAEMDRYIGAKSIVEGSHRLSTQEEIDAHLAETGRRKRLLETEEMLRKGVIHVSLPAAPDTVTKKGAK